MPRGDKTGPKGTGPMTGRAAGYCAGYTEPGFIDSPPRWARGGGRGSGHRGGRRHRNVFHATGIPGWQRAAMPGSAGYPQSTAAMTGWTGMTAAQERVALEQQVQHLEERLEMVKKRLSEMASSGDEREKEIS